MKTKEEIPFSLFDEMTEQKDYNFYGVIYDASFPVIEDSNSLCPFYEVTLKLIDPSMNCLSKSSTLQSIEESILTLIIKSNLKECMPYIHSIGDIIRVHHGSYNPAKRTAYLLLTGVTKIVSSWCLFSGKPDNDIKISTPLLCSHSSCFIDGQELEILNGIRKWLFSNFQLKNSLVYPNDVKLKDKKNDNQLNDTVVQIVSKFEYPDSIVYLIQDETERCAIYSFKYFNFFEVSDIIRITNYLVNESGQIQMKKNSNMLIVPSFTEYYKSFSNIIEKNRAYLDNTFAIPTPQINGNTTKKQESGQNSEKEDKTKINYICMVDENYSKNAGTLIDMTKQSTREIIDIKIKELVYPKVLYKFDNSDQQSFNLIFDCEIRNPDKTRILLHLCTFDGEGDGFIPIDPLYSNKDGSDIKEIIDRFIKNEEYYCKVMIEKVHFKMVNEKSDIIEFKEMHPDSQNYIYRIVGKYLWNNYNN